MAVQNCSVISLNLIFSEHISVLGEIYAVSSLQFVQITREPQTG